MRTLIQDVRVFDGERTLTGADVLIQDDRIAAPDGNPVDVTVPGAGRTLLPGLIDAHVHVFDGNLAQALTYGVTTELDMFCLPGNVDGDPTTDITATAAVAAVWRRGVRLGGVPARPA